MVHCIFLSLLGFELDTSDVKSDRSANCQLRPMIISVDVKFLLHKKIMGCSFTGGQRGEHGHQRPQVEKGHESPW